MDVPEHLGGYIPGGDPATQFPGLWRWLIEKWPVRSMIDVGCGEGQALSFFRSAGVEVLGLDGVEQDDPDIWKVDFTRTAYRGEDEVDLVWCCEFVEHVEERYIPNFLPALTALRPGGLLLMTHAFPGQPGHHHVNCREPEYWKGVVAAGGLSFNPHLTLQCRNISRANRSPWNHFLRSGLAFERLE